MKNAFPTLHIELTGVRQEVVHGFMSHMDEVKQYTKEAIDATFKSLLETNRLEQLILNTVAETMHELLTNNINEAIEESVSDYLDTAEGKQKIINAVMKGLVRDEQ